MAKCLFCLDCGAIKSFPRDGSTATCECAEGKVVGWWVDQDIALTQMAVLAPGRREKARVLLMDSRFLRADVETMPTGWVGPDGQLHPFDQGQIDTNWRNEHIKATHTQPRPESITVFDVSRRACPLVIQSPGSTPDTHWATEPELQQRGLLTPQPVGASAG